MLRIIIPYHLKSLADISGEVQLDVAAPVTLRSALDALEARYPMHSVGRLSAP
jgi:sulfur-carrier protein